MKLQQAVLHIFKYDCTFFFFFLFKYIILYLFKTITVTEQCKPLQSPSVKRHFTVCGGEGAGPEQP